jgi:alpha-glucosidase
LQFVCLLVYVELEYSWGYHDINETKEQVRRMREADIPLEGGAELYFARYLYIPIFLFTVMWNDIDLYREPV